MKKTRISENQLTLPFFSAQGARVVPLSIEDRTRIFWSVTGLFLISLMAYIYGINALSRTAALRQNLEREAMTLAADLATLEFQYISLKNDVTIEVAATRGFSEVKKPLYVSRHSEPSSLSLNTLER